MRLFWNGVDDNLIAKKVLKFIPTDFSGSLLDVPVGTAVFTYQKYKTLQSASITCLDYSEDMLHQAKKKFDANRMHHITLHQGEVGNLPFEDGSFDIVLSMNGFHAFPDKKKAYKEIHRVLVNGGKFIGCFYVKGNSWITDWLVNAVLSKKGWFTPPFWTVASLKNTLKKRYTIEVFHVEGSICYFCVTKKKQTQ